MTVKRKKRTKERQYKGPTVWKDEYYVQAYKLAKAGLGEEAIAAGLGVRYETYRHWRKKYPALNAAVKEGRKKDETGADTYQEYVYNRLSPDLQKYWDKMMECTTEGEPNAVSRLENILSDAGTRGRQMLFLHALIHYNFDLSQALHVTNISRRRFDTWLLKDPEFGRLIDEMDWHRKNFFEAQLYRLVAQGDPGIVKFVNQTKNADRGYAKVSTVNKNVHVSGEVRQVSIPIDELGMDVEQKRLALKKIRASKEVR